MPRCISKTSPDERSASRYLARRPRPSTVLPSSALHEILRQRPAQIGTPRQHLIETRALQRGLQARGAPFRLREVRACVNLLKPSKVRFVASPQRSRYGPAPDKMWPIAPMPTDRDTHFGYRTVPLGEKQALVDEVFHLGGAPLRPDERPDVGRTASRLEGRAGDGRQSAARASNRSRCWMSRAAPAMSLSGSRRRAAPAPTSRCATSIRTCWRSAASAPSSAALPTRSVSSTAMPRRCAFADRSFDAYTIAFGIRNVPRIEAALARGVSRAASRRALSLPRILPRRRARARPALRSLLLQCDPGARPHRGGRCRVLSIPRRVDPPVSAADDLRRHDPRPPGSAASSSRCMTGGIVALHSGWRL